MRKEFKALAGDLAAYVKTLDEDTYMSVTSKTVRQQDSTTAGQQDSKMAGKRGSKTVSVPDTVHRIPVTAREPGEMDTLAAEIGKCRKCQLGNSRINAVVGVGNPRAKVVFVGEGPGFQEDHKGEPFVGRSGQLLDKILETVLGLKREDVYIANIVKCHPMINPENPEAHGNDRPPTPEEISACRPYLDRQLMLIKPRCIVTLGSVATKVLLGVTQGISFVRGKWYDYPVELFGPGHPIKVLPTYHPAALLRNSNLKRDTWEDMKMLKLFLEKEVKG
ncbi:MAG: uracil-DNA glycosylase [Elusimicrobiota bacterium]